MTPHPQKAVGLKLFPIFVNSAHIPNFGHLTSPPFVCLGRVIFVTSPYIPLHTIAAYLGQAR